MGRLTPVRMDNTRRKLLLIVNPKAGSVGNKISPATLLKEAEKLSYPTSSGERLPYDVTLALTEYAGHASELASEAAKNGYYGVVACGGDGTVNEIARGVINTDTAMAIIPLGSGNGLARHLGIPMTVHGAFEAINEDRIIDADYASAGGRPFFCTFGVGFDAEVTDKFNARPGRGLKNYILTVLEEYFSYKTDTYTIIANGKRITEQALLVAVCNASQYGNNAYIAPHASIKDGLLDITVVHNGSIFENAISAMELLSGMIGKSAFTTTFRATDIRIIRNHEGAAHFDGEAAKLDKIIDVHCHPGALRLFATYKKNRLRPIMAPEIPFLSPLALTIRDLRHKIYNKVLGNHL